MLDNIYTKHSKKRLELTSEQPWNISVIGDKHYFAKGEKKKWGKGYIYLSKFDTRPSKLPGLDSMDARYSNCY